MRAPRIVFQPVIIIAGNDDLFALKRFAVASNIMAEDLAHYDDRLTDLCAHRRENGLILPM
jgi:hypothetical protein